MAAIYELCEMPDLHKNGEKVVYPRFRSIRQTGLDEIASYLCKETSFSEADVIGLIRALSGKLAVEMSRGHSVKLDGIGVFTPSLTFVDSASDNYNDMYDVVNTTLKIEIGKVNFRSDRKFLLKANSSLNLVKKKPLRTCSSCVYTAEKRLSIALDYLRINPYITVRKYMELTGLLHTTASLELRKWSLTAGSGIKSFGIGTHKRYMAD